MCTDVCTIFFKKESHIFVNDYIFISKANWWESIMYWLYISQGQGNVYTYPYTFKFRTHPLAGTASGMASDSVRGRGSWIVSILEVKSNGERGYFIKFWNVSQNECVIIILIYLLWCITLHQPGTYLPVCKNAAAYTWRKPGAYRITSLSLSSPLL